MRNLSDSYIGIGQQCPRHFEIVVVQLPRSSSGAANPPRGCKTCSCALADQAALEFRQGAEHVKHKDASGVMPGSRGLCVRPLFG